MLDRGILGGYPIEGTPTDGDWLWFTGEKWILIPYGTKGEIKIMTAPKYPNLPFTSNGYIVVIENLSPGDILAAIYSYNEEARRYHEYITNCKYPNLELGALNIQCSTIVCNSIENSFVKNNSALKIEKSYQISVEIENSFVKNNSALKIEKSYQISVE